MSLREVFLLELRCVGQYLYVSLKILQEVKKAHDTKFLLKISCFQVIVSAQLPISFHYDLQLHQFLSFLSLISKFDL